MLNNSKTKIMIKGGGDLASGVAYRLFKSGFKISMSELKSPKMVRRTVSFGEAIYRDEYQVEDIGVKSVKNWSEFKSVEKENKIPIFISDLWDEFKKKIEPQIIIDGRMMKRANETVKDEAPLVIGLGPGFKVGKDVDAVIETCRGHYLGRALYQGSALPLTGKPGETMGYTKKRVVHAPCEGRFKSDKDIGDHIEKGEIFGRVGKTNVKAELDGVIRGQIYPGIKVGKGWKIGDVDPRNKVEYCNKISDKAFAVGGGTLEAICHLTSKK